MARSAAAGRSLRGTQRPLATAKIILPTPPRAFRPQPAPLEALDGGPVVLAMAPAGFGKTSTVAVWARNEERRGARIAWLRCDPADGEIETFAPYLAAALHRALPGRLVPVRPPLPAPAALANHLAAVIEQAGPPLRLVLDDVHRLPAGSPVWQLIAALGEVLPPNAKLVLIAREVPAELPVARWRAQGRLAWCDSGHLRLPGDALAEILADRLGAVPPAIAARVRELSGGWPIVVALLADRLAQVPRAAWREVLGGAPRIDLVAQYFGAEVLAALDERERRFLLATSVLQQIDAPSVAAIWPDGDGPQLLGKLAATAFFSPVDPGTQRFQHHALFEAFLREEAERRLGADAVRRLHLQVARRAAAAGDPEAALLHAMEAGEWGLAAGLLARLAHAMLGAGRVGALEAPLRRLPEGVRRNDPHARLVAAYLAASRDEVASALEHASAGLDGLLAAGDTVGAAAAVAHLADTLPEGAPQRALAARLAAHPDAKLAAWAHLWELRLELGQAEPPAIREAIGRIEAAGLPAELVEEAHLFGGWLLYMAGSLEEITCTPAEYVRAIASQRFDLFPALAYGGRWDELAALLAAAREVEAPVWAVGPVRAWLRIPEAVLLMHTGRVKEADAHLLRFERDYLLTDAEGQSALLRPEFMSVYLAVRAGVALRMGRGEDALAMLRRNLQLLGGYPVHKPVAHLDLAQAHAWLGDLDEAARHLHDARELAADRGLRGLYHRTLAALLTRTGIWDVLAEVEAKGAHGFLPMYDPGPLRRTIEAARRSGEVPRRLRPTVERVLRLYALADGGPATAPETPVVTVRAFGGLAVERDGMPVPAPGARVAELFLRLVAASGDPVSRAEIGEAMWPDTPPDVQANRLRVTLHGLRRWLAEVGEGRRLEAGRQGMALDGGSWLGWDVWAWRDAVRAARRERNFAACAAALRIYRGPLLPEPHFHDAFFYERERCAREHAELALLASRLVPATDPRLPGLLGQAVASNPSDEALHAALVRCLLEQGEREQARIAAAACQQRLGGELPAAIRLLLLESAPPAARPARQGHGSGRAPRRRPG